MSDVYRELADYITASLGGASQGAGAVQDSDVRLGELMITVDASQIVQVMKFLRDDSNCLFKMLVDICGVDFPDREPRFDVVYHLLSLKHNYRIRVKVPVAEDAAVPSIVGVYSVAGWFERESYDMFGIFFDGNPDLRRILTDYGFEGHPFRKDFPLTGYVEVRYDEAQKRVVYEPVKLSQEFRSFDFLSPWEGMLQPRVLPGDEKAGKAE
ncbi:NADH-quinone oxidoreductase subunit C [Dongia soli]|uniref:NADH-quinone oxidoreductase subunit C n=1 Tax=Dongia soli TaxID=600628 RepID=A0ABU5EC07_9PROT|nr:NADH-quinone oxidoreductase subunit C [Dongia soli]MDY0883008.1 NADH-quinone oxidoreductase subunit C [Dongia soli]